MRVYPKVAFDLYIVQMTWTAYFLGIMLVIQAVKLIQSAFFGSGDVDFFYMNSFIASNIYMLVIGIIAIGFLSYYVEIGVTRRDYFKGTLLAAIGVSITIPIITILLSLVERLVTNLFTLTYRDPDISTAITEITGNDIGDIVGEIMMTIILTPYVDPADNLLLALVIFSLNIFTYYLLGWFISSTFHHSGVIAGLGAILLALVLLIVEDSFIRFALNQPVMGMMEKFATIPSSIGLLIVFFILIIVASFIRQLTKKVRIKM